MNNRKTRITKIKIVRWLIVLTGIVVGQFFLYGPSLVGQKVLLPLDILAQERIYLPVEPIWPQDYTRSDLIYQWEPSRQFAISELQAGRLPMWNPYEYAGAPVVWPKFSPFLLLECCSKSPLVLAWVQLLTAIVAGFGIYFFLRCTRRVAFWAAAIPAWCYPLTGFFILWQGYPAVYPAAWLPWLLLAVDGTVRRKKFSPIGLSVVTGLLLVSGNSDIGGQALLVSGLYAVWCILDEYRKDWFRKQARRAVGILAMSWLLGILLATPYLLPLLEYAHTGARIERRSAGFEERPPIGLSALPEVVLPDIYGSTQKGTLNLGKRVQIESSATAYAGLMATLFVAPLAFCSRKRRSAAVFFGLLTFFSLSWCLNVPGVVAILRLPGLNMMSHNRLTFAAAFSIFVLVSLGLDAIRRGQAGNRRWFMLPIGLLIFLLAWNFCRTFWLPEPVASELELRVNQHQSWDWIHNLDDVRQVQSWFASSYATATTLCGVSLIGWLLLLLRPRWPAWSIPVLGIFLAAELIQFGNTHNVQCDPSLYYPRIPALKSLARSAPGRIVGFNCFPALLAQTHGLRDIRGYDAVDPAQFVDLIMLAAHPGFHPFQYAQAEWFFPGFDFSPPSGVHLAPVLDMLNVRYMIFRGAPTPELKPLFSSPDYFVLVNNSALPRPFVPRHVETITNAIERLHKLSSPQFNPREVAYVEEPVNLSDICEGTAEIINEIPTRISISTQMKTPGLVVLADLWDKGWNAYLNGQHVPILRANHAVRGVLVPVGASTLEFRYEPASFRHGLQLAGFASIALLFWLGIIYWQRKQAQTNIG